MADRKATAMDKEIGRRIRACRDATGVTLEELARAVGVTWQQVQKYESGRNRIPASRLVVISITLKVPPEFFLRGVSQLLDREEA